MPLTKRDKEIIADLNRFRVMDRNSIAEIHFSGLKKPITAANAVLLRLLRDGHIQRSTSFSPYVYFCADNRVKKNSAKIGHWLAILDVYKQMRRHNAIQSFTVEPKLGLKGTAEPDIYAIFRKTPFYIEVQRTQYSVKVLAAKLQRYADLHRMKPFPHLLIISEVKYELTTEFPFRVFQAKSFTGFIESLKPIKEVNLPKEIDGIKIKIN
ncbi:hypothetical protein MHI57_10805 [Cytobacillus sp. FSL K6-0129]|uniref:hypothetical protein n=1 Tax=Cytobacillus sp. FSL K6-0129 TaxID=2921421 RepID=UPI0030F6A765